MASGPITSWKIDEEAMETVRDFIYLCIYWLQNHCRWWLQPWNSEMLAPWKKTYDQPRQHIKKQKHYFANKGPSSQSYGFSRSHVWMWEWNYKESWPPKNWCFWTVALEKTHGSSLDSKEIQPAYSKGNQSWIFIGRTDAEAETPRLWPPDMKNWLIWKDTDAGKDWGWEEKGMTEDEMAGWHHQLNRHQFSSVQFSCSVVSNSLRPHGLQHTRLPCPSPTPRACSNSCSLSRWCHPTISSSVVPFSSCLQFFPASGSFPVSQFFPSGGQSLGVSASASVFPMNIQDWFLLGWTGWISLLSKGLSIVFSNTTVQKHRCSVLSLLYGPTLTSIHDS